MRGKFKCDLQDCAYCRPVQHVYKYNRHDSDLSEEFLQRWWDRVKNNPVDLLFQVYEKESLPYEG
jgi:hypothetical protein